MGKPAVHGFKAHIGPDVDTTLIEEVAVAPADVDALPMIPTRSLLTVPTGGGISGTRCSPGAAHLHVCHRREPQSSRSSCRETWCSIASVHMASCGWQAKLWGSFIGLREPSRMRE